VRAQVRTTAVLPELAVPRAVLVVSLPARVEPADLVREWLQLDPELAGHRDELHRLATAASVASGPGEVALLLDYRARSGRLVGGSALLALEPIPPLTSGRADPAEHTDGLAGQLAGDLRELADRRGLGPVAEVGTRRTESGIWAARLRFLAIASTALPLAAGPATAERDDDAAAPMVEICRWLYPVPGRPDLAWSLVYQTTDVADADELVAEFDELAGRLAWA
jgi:hypothetical protein